MGKSYQNLPLSAIHVSIPKLNMPITDSAKKAVRNSARKREFNLARKLAMNDLVKKIKKLAAEGKLEDAKKILPQTQQAIDKAVKTHLIDKNTGARKKSRIAKLFRIASGK